MKLVNIKVNFLFVTILFSVAAKEIALSDSTSLLLITLDKIYFLVIAYLKTSWSVKS